ncbi:LytTR family DNA-binding domain-containing protein [Lacrimispora sp. NSJ-141]|uniref:Stage 0 sporulation protein A homolog n=1 Tax=Lientehia hominis TaxID=2897778 RepID=A0AAP2RJW6_9FIRM|nr:LytTR family DNA-binding domain-containing protein [Lientehia hominis]MCD2493372.1 LytTR family DNA-binding domain-containing protein [Lientehia hominis]
MPTLAVCDDDSSCLEQIATLARSFFDTQDSTACIDVYPDAESLLASGKRYDLYLLDILMPGRSGIELAKEIRLSDRDCVLIYLTTSDEYALYAYQVGALQYLLKPVRETDFQETMEKALRLLIREEPPRMAVPTPRGTIQVNLLQTAYIEHYEKTLYFHMRDGNVVRTSTASLTLHEIAPQVLSCPDFIPQGRAYLINMDCVRLFSADIITMEDGANIPVARRTYRETKDRYMDFLLKKGGS